MLTVSNIAWHDGNDPAFLKMVAGAGFDGIDLAPSKIWPGWQLPEDRGIEFRNCLNSYGLSVVGMQSLFFGAGPLNLFSKDTENWEAFLLHTKTLAAIAVATGATRIVFGAPANRDPGDMNDELAWELACERLRVVGDLFARNDIQLCLEPVPEKIGGKFLKSTSETADFLRKINHSSIKLNLDTAVLLHEKADIQKTIEEYAALIGHVHASEPSLGNFDQPEADHVAVRSALQSIGYEGTVAIEMAAKPGFEASNLTRALNYIKSIYG
jgi:D-psicose/D-tagatose/L-ribulose 3-epimerase